MLCSVSDMVRLSAILTQIAKGDYVAEKYVTPTFPSGALHVLSTCIMYMFNERCIMYMFNERCIMYMFNERCIMYMFNER